jgi:hypothetical protein
MTHFHQCQHILYEEDATTLFSNIVKHLLEKKWRCPFGGGLRGALCPSRPHALAHTLLFSEGSDVAETMREPLEEALNWKLKQKTELLFWRRVEGSSLSLFFADVCLYSGFGERK